MENEYYISTVAIDITYKCPFRCIHCFNTSGEHTGNRDELSDLEWQQVIKDLTDINVTQLSIGGGEALLRKELLLEMTDIIKQSGKLVDIAVVSNGYFMTQELAYQLAAGNVMNVQISVDGFKENYERIRKMEGAYERAIQAIKYLHKAGINVSASFAPTTFNINDLSELFNYLRSIGVSFFRCQPLMLLGRAEKYLFDYMPSYEDYRKIAETLEQKKIQYPDMFIEWGDPIDHLVRGRLRKAQVSYITIGAYGDILVSPYLPLVFGNVRKHSIKDYLNAGLLNIWTNPFLQNVSELVVDASKMNLSGVGLPPIFTEEPIELDILDKNYEAKTKMLIEKYF